MIKLLFFILLNALAGCSSRLSTAPSGTNSIPLVVTAPPGSVAITPDNTRITFVGSTLMVSHEGTFTRFGGWMVCPNRVADKSRLFVKIDMDSVFTEIPLLTKHLKADDFFDVVKYPDAVFASTAISTNPATPRSCTVTGNLTLHGVTKPIAFPAEIQIDPSQVSMQATIILHQSDFSMASVRTTNNDVPVTVNVRIPRASLAPVAAP